MQNLYSKTFLEINFYLQIDFQNFCSHFWTKGMLNHDKIIFVWGMIHEKPPSKRCRIRSSFIGSQIKVSLQHSQPLSSIHCPYFHTMANFDHISWVVAIRWGKFLGLNCDCHGKRNFPLALWAFFFFSNTWDLLMLYLLLLSYAEVVLTMAVIVYSTLRLISVHMW